MMTKEEEKGFREFLMRVHNLEKEKTIGNCIKNVKRVMAKNLTSKEEIEEAFSSKSQGYISKLRTSFEKFEIFKEGSNGSH